MALHHAGFAVPSRLLGTRWALTPPFHPYLAFSPATAHSRVPFSDLLKVFLQPATEVIRTGGLFSVALSVTEPSKLACARRDDVGPLALPGALPNGVRTFLPACLLAKAGPAITRPARQRKYITLHRPKVRLMRRKNTRHVSLRQRMNKMGSKRLADYCLTNLDRNPEECGAKFDAFLRR